MIREVPPGNVSINRLTISHRYLLQGKSVLRDMGKGGSGKEFHSNFSALISIIFSDFFRWSVLFVWSLRVKADFFKLLPIKGILPPILPIDYIGKWYCKICGNRRILSVNLEWFRSIPNLNVRFFSVMKFVIHQLKKKNTPPELLLLVAFWDRQC